MGKGTRAKMAQQAQLLNKRMAQEPARPGTVEREQEISRRAYFRGCADATKMVADVIERCSKGVDKAVFSAEVLDTLVAKLRQHEKEYREAEQNGSTALRLG